MIHVTFAFCLNTTSTLVISPFITFSDILQLSLR